MKIFAWGSSYYLLVGLAASIVADTGWPLPWVVGAITAGLVCADIVLPSVGRTINRHGGRPVLVAACFVLAAGLLLVAIAPNLPIIMSVGARSASAWVAISMMPSSRPWGGSMAPIAHGHHEADGAEGRRPAKDYPTGWLRCLFLA